MKRVQIHVLLPFLLCSLFGMAQEGTLDPSIFDGSNTEVSESKPETGGTPEAEESGEASPRPDADRMPGGMPEPPGGGEEEPLSPAETAAGSEVSEREGEEEPQSGEALNGGEEEEEEQPLEEPESAGSGSAAPASRAGEQVQTTDRITPGQAVDLPWDL